MNHITHSSILQPTHALKVAVIGCGGTGSHLAYELATLDHSLRKLNHAGLAIDFFDPSEVRPCNTGRQKFQDWHVGINKAVQVCSDINREYGTTYRSYPIDFFKHKLGWDYDLYFTCVDKVEPRKKLNRMLKASKKHYWFDMGNSQFTGQIIWSTKGIPSSVDLFPNMEDDDSTPSCSHQDSFNSQDLFINSFIAKMCAKLLWDMIRKPKTVFHGLFINIANFITNPVIIEKSINRINPQKAMKACV